MAILNVTLSNKKYRQKTAPLVTIIIPVKNGQPRFGEVLKGVLDQEVDFGFEILVIDSGSNDGSLELAKKMGGLVRVIEIEPSSFGHGKTRNYGVELSKGRFCAFLTHDAKPFDAYWLQHLVAPLLEDDDIAGVFGRHVAYANADPYTKWMLDTHFNGLSKYPLVQINDARSYVKQEGLRKIYHFYSDNSSCLRKSIWRDFPYPDIDFAEDQKWAQQIIEAGYKKAYAHDSVVYHSHDYSIWETFQRSYDESRAFFELFGYKSSPTKKLVWKNWVYLCKRDLKLGLKNGWIFKYPLSFFSRPFRNFSALLGAHYGTNNPDFMMRNENHFSKDRSLKTLNSQ